MKKLSSFFKDDKGSIAVWQRPNLLLTTWFAATVLAKIFSHGRSYKFLAAIAFGAIFAWAWMEISRGDSAFRRLLGAVVMVLSVYSRTR